MNEHLCHAMKEEGRDGYLHYHAPRYAKLLQLLARYDAGSKRILDIGRSPFTGIAHKSFGVAIDTLGFEPDKKTETGFNYNYDLNGAQSRRGYRLDLPKYDIIVFSEVIEHLYTAPSLVLRFLRSILDDQGMVFLQTPNAVVLHKRIQFLLGQNPFHLIAEDTSNPAHFREYTMGELVAYCVDAGFSVLEKSYENYFDYRYTNHVDGHFSVSHRNAVVNWFYRLAPPGFRPGLCLVIRKQPDPAENNRPG